MLDKRVKCNWEMKEMAPLFPPQRHAREILNLEARASKEDKK